MYTLFFTHLKLLIVYAFVPLFLITIILLFLHCLCGQKNKLHNCRQVKNLHTERLFIITLKHFDVNFYVKKLFMCHLSIAYFSLDDVFGFKINNQPKDFAPLE